MLVVFVTQHSSQDWNSIKRSPRPVFRCCMIGRYYKLVSTCGAQTSVSYMYLSTVIYTMYKQHVRTYHQFMHACVCTCTHVPFQCLRSLMPRGLWRISDGTSIWLIRCSSKGMSARRPQVQLWPSIQRFNSSLDTPRSAQCMYSGDIPLMKSKEFRQQSHEGPLTPVTYSVYHQEIQCTPTSCWKLYIPITVIIKLKVHTLTHIPQCAEPLLPMHTAYRPAVFLQGLLVNHWHMGMCGHDHHCLYVLSLLAVHSSNSHKIHWTEWSSGPWLSQEGHSCSL